MLLAVPFVVKQLAINKAQLSTKKLVDFLMNFLCQTKIIAKEKTQLKPKRFVPRKRKQKKAEW